MDRLLSKCRAQSQDAEKEADPLSWLQDVHTLCSLLCGETDAALLQRVMTYFQG